MASAQDNMADQLNARSLQASQQGRNYSGSGASGSNPAMNDGANPSMSGGGSK
jgi:hypothetical protein